MNSFIAKGPFLELNAHRQSPVRSERAFTLVEMLVVLSIVVLVATLTLPALHGMLDGVNLTGSADDVAAQFSLARQTAMSRNLPVEMRIYKRDIGHGQAWNTLTLVIPALVSGKASDEWVGSPSMLNGNVIIDPGTSATGGSSFSTVLTAATTVIPTTAAPSPAGPWTTTESTTAPTGIKGLPYVAFRFQPDGSTDLPAKDASGNSTPWCLTLRNFNAPAAQGGIAPATDYVALVIDPATGRTLTFRP